MSFTVIEYKNLKFVIFDAPTNKNIHIYLQKLKNLNVTHVVRVCDSSYNENVFIQNGISVITMPFADGDPPPRTVIDKFLEMIDKKNVIAVHCVAGLGRAPALVAVALIEHGMDPLDAVEYIRSKRVGAINNKQLLYLESYKKHKSCSIM